MREWAEKAMERAVRKYRAGIEIAKRQHAIPYQGSGDQWIGPPFDGDAWWTNGFWPGLMWQLFAASGDAAFADEARRVQAKLRAQLRDHHALNHDVGFMFLLSFGADERLGGPGVGSGGGEAGAGSGGEAAANVVLQAADLLAGRFNPNGFIRAWNGQGREGWAIVDCLMNLPLLWWASERTGDPRYRLIARIHADATIRHFLREDGSCNHIVIFNAETGEELDAPAGQGYAPGSSWSRGQAWALYGFALEHQNSGEARYLDAARRVADYFISHIRPDGLTDSDFCQPGQPERIDNIAGAVAACGLLLLADQTGQPKYRQSAEKLLRALDELCADWNEASCGILQRCTASYHDDGAGRDVNLMYGDYFFVEALNRLTGVDLHLWGPNAKEGDKT